METDNGTEAQNKLLKYSYLPRKRDLTLSSIVEILIHHFLPDQTERYLFINYKASTDYRSYDKSIPSYLHNRPSSIVAHCLERKSSALKFCAEDVYCNPIRSGVFHVKSQSQKDVWHTVEFGFFINYHHVLAQTGKRNKFHASTFLLCFALLKDGIGRICLPAI